MRMRRRLVLRVIAIAAAAIGAWTGTEARAQSLQHVTYVGGTALHGSGLEGKLSIAQDDVLKFYGPSTIAVPYDHVISYESKIHRKVHVGLLTEGVWRLLAPWPEEKQLSLSYRDTNDHPQVLVLQLSKGDEAVLVEVLKTRVSRTSAWPQLSPIHTAVK